MARYRNSSLVEIAVCTSTRFAFVDGVPILEVHELEAGRFLCQHEDGNCHFAGSLWTQFDPTEFCQCWLPSNEATLTASQDQLGVNFDPTGFSESRHLEGQILEVRELEPHRCSRSA